jgi:hypothetical protein
MNTTIAWSKAPLVVAALIVVAGCNAVSGIGKYDFQGAGGAGQGGHGGGGAVATTASVSSSSASSSGTGGDICTAPVTAPTAASLLALVTKGHQVATGYKNDYDQTAANLTVRQVGEAYLWEAGMSIDCDGMSAAPCSDLMPPPDPETSLHTTSDQALDSVNLAFAVLPASGCGLFDFAAHGVAPGSVVVVVNEKNNAIEYGVFGDVGDCHSLGSGSYKMAKRLGINSDPAAGGTASKVLYIVFKGPCATLTKPESHQEAVDRGEALAAKVIAAAL